MPRLARPASGNGDMQDCLSAQAPISRFPARNWAPNNLQVTSKMSKCCAGGPASGSPETDVAGGQPGALIAEQTCAGTRRNAPEGHRNVQKMRRNVLEVRRNVPRVRRN